MRIVKFIAAPLFVHTVERTVAEWKSINGYVCHSDETWLIVTDRLTAYHADKPKSYRMHYRYQVVDASQNHFELFRTKAAAIAYANAA